jgi:putative tricarboxylic transport membrane protein
MDPLLGILSGFSTALTLNNLFNCLLGCFLGTLTGILPGFGPAAAVALLLPMTLYLSPSAALIMLAGIYYGAMYGGSSTSILINIPGEAASVVTCFDGYKMALQGRAGPALGIAAFGSFIAGTLSVLGLMFVAPPLAEFALSFTSTEYVAIIFFGMTLLCFMGSGSRLKAFMMAAVGILLGTVGTDPVLSRDRFTFGFDFLMDGVGLIPVIMGLFGIGEVLANLEAKQLSPLIGKIKNLLPSRADWAASAWPMIRGTVIGFFYGILPGGNAIISSILSYGIERRLSKHPERFGTGTIEGVAGPEACNNATATSAFIPLLTLGIPTNAVMAIMLAALMIHEVTPGPLLIAKRPDIFWGVIASMYIGNLILLALNLPLIGIWVRLLRISYAYLFSAILLFCLIGAYAIKGLISDIGIMIFFGGVGFLMRKFEYEPAPLVLAYILGPLFEDNLRRSLNISGGDFGPFFTRPISLVFILMSAALIAYPFVPRIIRRRNAPFPSDNSTGDG